jgi:hypothetical protein
MAKMNLNEEEAAVIRKQFGDYMIGNSTDESMFLSEEMTMHTDGHTDSHADSHADAIQIEQAQS